jgi:hypothetical protein
MKLCPQCAFIYEDHQRFCDMDGKELVLDPASVAAERIVSPPTKMTISLPVQSELPARSEGLPAKSQARRLPILVTVGIVLATLLVVIYFAQLHRSSSSNAAHSPVESPARSTGPDSSRQPSPADLVSSTSVAVTPLPEQSPAESSSSPTNAVVAGSSLSFPQSSQSPSSAAPVTRARLASSPVSAGALSANNRGRVIVRLTNGAVINADEAWERRDGIWYRQAGVVTFLKPSRVRTIERIAPPQPPKSAANNSAEKSRKLENGTAPSQLRIRRLEPVDTKKQSRVSSFLKMTGRILKKPFKG